MRSVERLTEQLSTPSILPTDFSIRDEQAAQVIPVTFNVSRIYVDLPGFFF